MVKLGVSYGVYQLTVHSFAKQQSYKTSHYMGLSSRQFKTHQAISTNFQKFIKLRKSSQISDRRGQRHLVTLVNIQLPAPVTGLTAKAYKGSDILII